MVDEHVIHVELELPHGRGAEPATKWLPTWLGCEPRFIVLSLV